MEFVVQLYPSFKALPPFAQLLIVYVFLQNIDILVGVGVAFVQGGVSSKANWRGLVRKALTDAAILTAGTVELVSDQLPVPAQGILIVVQVWFIGNELLSIAETLAKVGIVNPAFFEFTRQFRDAIGRSGSQTMQVDMSGTVKVEPSEQ